MVRRWFALLVIVLGLFALPRPIAHATPIDSIVQETPPSDDDATSSSNSDDSGESDEEENGSFDVRGSTFVLAPAPILRDDHTHDEIVVTSPVREPSTPPPRG